MENSVKASGLLGQKTCIKEGHEVYLRYAYLRLSKDEQQEQQQQVQWPRTIAILRDVLIQVSVYLYRLITLM